MPQGSRYAGRNLQIDRKRCQSALKRDTKAPGELFKILRGLILRIIKHRYVCYPQIEIVLHRFFCTKNLSHHRLFSSASVQLMHNHRTSFYVPARFFNSMSQSSIFGKNVDFPLTHQNYILNLSSSAHRSHGLFARKKRKYPVKTASRQSTGYSSMSPTSSARISSQQNSTSGSILITSWRCSPPSAVQTVRLPQWPPW